jgi:hypothetical protein
MRQAGPYLVLGAPVRLDVLFDLLLRVLSVVLDKVRRPFVRQR